MSKDTNHQTNSIVPVVLCGGSGTRLWPLSRKSFPKQFVPLIDNQSLLTLTAKRLSLISEHLIFVGAEEHRFLIKDALEGLDTQNDLILEPFPKNTAAAMALAALFTQENGKDSDSLLLFCPADHHIPDIEAFNKTILNGVEDAKQSSIVTFGVSPSCPSSAYGYIESKKLSTQKSSKVVSFIEKPSTQRAEEFLLQGNHYWNSGIFLCSVSTILQALKVHAPDILACCEMAMKLALSEKLNSFETQDTYHFICPNKDALMKCRSESIDYAVMEHHPNIFMVPFEAQWSDVGSWSALSDLSPKDDQGNQTIGDAIQFDSTNTYINSQKQMVVTLGVENLLIINTTDALLIAHKNKSEQVKEVVSHLVRLDDSKAILHRKVSRPWGWFDSIDQGDRFQVKRISVKPGASLSLQKHHHRAEHWIVVKGTAEVTRGTETFLLTENQSTYIPIGEVHRLRNPGKTDLEMIEVQSGSYLGEDDIVRLEDTYGRTST
jgi:mannose-1-phosphate guanylyltransferase/mannose-6-phosphate isomerase